MDVKKVGIAIVVIFVLFFVISQPQNSADFVTGILSALGDVASSLILFLRNLVS
ncbi:hypothetical protein [Actinomycetospora termitidis]|uniref:Uncharacterized protein n=1 Tax=Actinomycetospora termitidis TaxID=3053470 RepID=A0ABT7M9H6_9PSEU|nr:hypothetical protein [Actinomycetospora sp. Odt1-22]MDL5157320.1 hypothetical protein [Actinomycetospora sp. Odt1-22]